MANTAFPRPSSRPVSRRTVITAAAAAAAFGVATPSALASPYGAARPGADALLRRRTRTVDQARMLGWARDTWHCMVAMTDPGTGLVADNIPGSLSPGGRSRFTSPTNIGGYLWSAVAARDLGIITAGECTRRVRQTLATLLRMDVHDASGMYVNWYDPPTGDVVRVWPENGSTVVPFYSSVDNGWLGAALYVVRNSVPGARELADRLWQRMRWDMFYDPFASRPGGLIHGGFYEEDPGSTNTAVFKGNHIGVGPDVWYTDHHYDTTVSETRITTYLGLIRGQVPPTNYYALWRTFPATCDWSWHEMQPVGVTRNYYGIEVYEGAYTYRGMRIVPGWGGSMFEELMPAMFVPEESWAPRSWGVNHPLHVRAQREHGLLEAGYGYWGFSPSSDPAGGYREFGVDLLGLNPDGYFSDEEKTNVDVGFGDCRPATNPHPTFADGVVTPHASFLALMFEPDAAFANLSRIETELGAYGAGGFFDAVAVRSGTIAQRYLSLDQAMAMGSLGNVLAGGDMRRAFATRQAEQAIRPVIGIETFGAGA
ncbi:MAG TPA: glucoamylase family protein [Dermatophilaceae bacterium]|nr:glucoamylase family protein [Dermatophilaceae bacterium]